MEVDGKQQLTPQHLRSSPTLKSVTVPRSSAPSIRRRMVEPARTTKTYGEEHPGPISDL